MKQGKKVWVTHCNQVFWPFFLQNYPAQQFRNTLIKGADT